MEIHGQPVVGALKRREVGLLVPGPVPGTGYPASECGGLHSCRQADAYRLSVVNRNGTLDAGASAVSV